MTPLQRLQVFMLYPNAAVKTSNIRHENNIKVFEYIEATGFDAFYWFKNGQLILRSIDQLTEEEKRELSKIDGYNLEEITNIDVDETGICFFAYNYQSGYYWEYMGYNSADYLRSKNIALPYMGIDLFAEGIAVRETN